MATTTNTPKRGPHSICRLCDVGFIRRDDSCALCGDAKHVYRCGGPGKCVWCKNRWTLWSEEPQQREAGMSFKGTVIEGGKLALENGARLRYGADDCAETLRPGDRVVIDTGRSPSISKAAAFTPVRETKVSGIDEAKALIERLAEADEL